MELQVIICIGCSILCVLAFGLNMVVYWEINRSLKKEKDNEQKTETDD